MPSVVYVYVSLGEEKGSEISGERMERSTGEGESAGRNGGCERRRTASRIVGWKGPPCGEWWRRWVGRTWPRVKKEEKALESCQCYVPII